MPLFTPRTDVAEARKLIADGAVLLDVRNPDEWTVGRARGAVHIPLPQLADRTGKLPRDRKIVVVCRSGNRSRVATRKLRKLGFDAVNLAGGMRGWAAAGNPVVRSGGKPGRVA